MCAKWTTKDLAQFGHRDKTKKVVNSPIEPFFFFKKVIIGTKKTKHAEFYADSESKNEIEKKHN